MWEVMISVPWALRGVLMELLGVLQDRRLRKVFSCAAEDACIYPLAVSDRADLQGCACLPRRTGTAPPPPSPPNGHLLQ